MQILRNRNSELKKKIEAFLVSEAIWERPGLRLLLLSSQLGNRKDNAAFTKNLRTALESLLKELQDTKCIASEWVEEQLKVL